MSFYFKARNKDIILTKEDEEHFRNTNTCCFCDQPLDRSNNFGDHCPLTAKCRGPAHEICSLNVKQKQSSFIPIALHNFSNYACHLFFKKKLIEKKKDDVKLDVITKTNEEYIRYLWLFSIH